MGWARRFWIEILLSSIIGGGGGGDGGERVVDLSGDTPE